MSDPRHARLADVLVGYSTSVGPGDAVRIESYGKASPLVRELYAATLRAGGHPTVNLVLDESEETLLAEGNEEQLAWIPLDQEWNIDKGDVWMVIDAPTNTVAAGSAPTAASAARKASGCGLV